MLDQGLEADLVADIQKYLEDLISAGLRQRLISLIKVWNCVKCLVSCYAFIEGVNRFAIILYLFFYESWAHSNSFWLLNFVYLWENWWIIRMQMFRCQLKITIFLNRSTFDLIFIWVVHRNIFFIRLEQLTKYLCLANTWFICELYSFIGNL